MSKIEDLGYKALMNRFENEFEFEILAGEDIFDAEDPDHKPKWTFEQLRDEIVRRLKSYD